MKLIIWACNLLAIRTRNRKAQLIVAVGFILLGLYRLKGRKENLEYVVTAKDSEEAVELTQELLRDVAIVGVAIPKMNGIDATKHTKTAYSVTAILTMSHLV